MSIRAGQPDDWPAIVGLLRDVLGKHHQARYDEFLRWKHHENPLGPSPTWVAVSSSGELAGVRTFLRWPFEVDGAVVTAVRAVDTATSDRFRGRGVFRNLTMAAIEELTAAGVGFVFNTPNDQSRPGYLTMGWRPLGRPALAIRPQAWWRAVGLVRSRGPADLFGEPTDAGRPVEDALAGLATHARTGVRTAYDASFAAWRFGFEPLGYRSLPVGDGHLVFRLRRRRDAVEATTAATTTGAPTAGAVRALLRETGATYAAWCPPAGNRAGLAISSRRLAPLVVVRPLAIDPDLPMDRWHLTAGDLELF